MAVRLDSSDKRDLRRSVTQALMNTTDYFVAFMIAVMTGCGWAYDFNLNLTVADMWTYLQSILIISVIIHLIFTPLESDIHVSVNGKIRLVTLFVIIITFSYYNKVNSVVFFERNILVFSWIVLWLILHDDKQIIWRRFVDVVIAIAIMSLVLYFFGSIISVIPEYNSAKRVWGEWDPKIIRNFYYFYYESHYIEIGDFILWRNVGCFAEGPMYNFVLCTALGAELFLRNKKAGIQTDMGRNSHIIRVTVLVITIITTISTTGFIFLAVVGAICLIKKSERCNAFRFLRSHMRLFVLLIAIILTGIVLLKLISPNGRGSMNVRIDHLFACIEAFRRKPIVGCGWSNIAYIYRFANYKQGISVGLLSFMAYGGVLLSSVLFIPIIKSIKKEKKDSDYIIFELLFLLLFFFTIVNAYPILWFFIAYITVSGSERADEKSFNELG